MWQTRAATVQGVIPLEDAQSFVLNQCPPRQPVTMASRDAGGLVLAADVTSAEVVPPFDNTAVDGYAVRADDLATVPVVLTVVDEIAAGSVSDHVLQPGEAIRIMTGAPVPAGADTMVMVEDTERVGDHQVSITIAPEPGAAIRRAGEDVKVGDVVLSAGTVISPAVVGVLASINARQVEVFPRVRVAVLSTGDELVTDDRPLKPGEIRESNSQTLVGLLTEAGCDVGNLGVIADDEAELERLLTEAASDYDAIVTSGGVSMGDYDVVKAVLGRIAEMNWMQVAIKPAKPFAFGTIAGVPVFGLPGNPVSSIVSFEMFTRPALRQMMGHRRLARPGVIAIADDGLTRKNGDGKTHLLRINTRWDDDGRCHVASVRAQGSHQLAASALADGLAVVADEGGIPPGGEVFVLLFDRR